MKRIVISGINIVEGGALEVFRDCVEEFVKFKKSNIEIIILVHKKKFFVEFENDVQIIEFPKAKKRWVNRLFYEYIYFYFFSKKINIDIWISMHDITPNVIAGKKYVYCHNPSPFYEIQFSDLKYARKYILWNFFYKYIYKINIKSNTNVIVQQQWLKKEFEKMFNINNVIVSRPIKKIHVSRNITDIQIKEKDKYLFIYPAYPRYFKNFEIICEAAQILRDSNVKNFKILLTIDGSENNYSKDIVKKYGSVEEIEFKGLIDRSQMPSYYQMSDCLIFSSKLETWGLPISEYKEYKKPMILIDLPYAHEALGNYKKVNFFHKNDAKGLSVLMYKVIQSKNIYEGNQDIFNAAMMDWEKLAKSILV